MLVSVCAKHAAVLSDDGDYAVIGELPPSAMKLCDAGWSHGL